MKRLVFAALILLAAATAQAQTGTRLTWDRETTGIATSYEVIVTTTTLSSATEYIGPLIADVSSTHTLASGRVYADFPGAPPVGFNYYWYVRAKSAWGVVSPWSVPVMQTMKPPAAPKGLKVEAKP